MSTALTRVVHLNSYFVTNRLHAELVEALDQVPLDQLIYVPVQRAADIGRNRPDRPLRHGTLEYSRCFGPVTRRLWPAKMALIWRDFARRYQVGHRDVLHAHSLFVNGLVALGAARRWRRPYLVTVRNTDVNVFMKRFPPFRKLGAKILRGASRVVVLSPAYGEVQLRQSLQDDVYAEVQRKLMVVPNGINDFWLDNRRSKRGLGQEARVLFVGRVDRNKNLATLIRACELLAERGGSTPTVHVAGDGPLLPRLRQRRWSVRIQYHGHVSSRRTLLALYRDADVLAVPSLRESFGLVYPEAMSQGLPVIYTRGQGFDGYFEDGQVGYAVQATDPREIADRLEDIFAGYERISRGAFEGSTLFAWERVTDQLASAYEEALGD